jgi:phosphoribosylglycinamide formyltransferase-1
VSSNNPQSFEWKERDRTASLPRETETQNRTLRLGVLISGSGSNLQALIDAIESHQLPGVEIALVVSNKADAYGLQRALKHKLPAIYLPWRQQNVGARFIAPKPIAPKPIASETKLNENESRLTALLNLFQVDLVVLAGWMRILSAPFLEQFPRRVINIHPALLPDDGTGSTYTTSDGTQTPVFRGLHAVQQALDAGVKITGSSVHYVTPEVDAGPVICREEMAIREGDTDESLHERLKAVEHRLIVEAVRVLRQTSSN